MAQDPEKSVPEDERDEREDDLEAEESVVFSTDPDRPTCPRCGWHNTRLSHTKIPHRYAASSLICKGIPLQKLWQPISLYPPSG